MRRLPGTLRKLPGTLGGLEDDGGALAAAYAGAAYGVLSAFALKLIDQVGHDARS